MKIEVWFSVSEDALRRPRPFSASAGEKVSARRMRCSVIQVCPGGTVCSDFYPSKSKNGKEKGFLAVFGGIEFRYNGQSSEQQGSFQDLAHTTLRSYSCNMPL